MATRVIWYSDKEGHPSGFLDTIDAAQRYCLANDIAFNQLVNQALRKFLALSEVPVGKRGGARGGAKRKPKPMLGYQVGQQVHCSKGRSHVDGQIVEVITTTGGGKDIIKVVGYQVRTASGSRTAVYLGGGWQVYKAY